MPTSGTVVPRTRDRGQAVSLDVVIPLWNEEAMAGPLADCLSATFTPDALAARRIRRVRFVLVDDGSTDRTAELLGERIAGGLPAVLYRFSRNFGHQAAVSAGLDHARADVTAVIDGDLQDPPGLILEMVDRWREGSDVVYAERRSRRGSPVKRAAYVAFYRLLAFLV